MGRGGLEHDRCPRCCGLMRFTLAELAAKARTARARIEEQLKDEYATPELANVRHALMQSELVGCRAELEIIADYLECHAGVCDPA